MGGRAIVVAWAEPQRAETESKSVWVGGIAADTTEEDMKAVFEPFGTVTNVVLPKSRDDPTKLRDYAFVHFSERAAAQKAVLCCETSKPEVKGKTWEVKMAKPQVSSADRAGPGGMGRGGYGGGRGGMMGGPYRGRGPSPMMAGGRGGYGGRGYGGPGPAMGRGGGGGGRGGFIPTGRGAYGHPGGYGGGYDNGYGAGGGGYGGGASSYGGGYGGGPGYVAPAGGGGYGGSAMTMMPMMLPNGQVGYVLANAGGAAAGSAGYGGGAAAGGGFGAPSPRGGQYGGRGGAPGAGPRYRPY